MEIEIGHNNSKVEHRGNRKMERTDNCIRYDDWERQGLRLSEGDQRGVEGGWSAVSILCWCVGWDGKIITCLWPTPTVVVDILLEGVLTSARRGRLQKGRWELIPRCDERMGK